MDLKNRVKELRKELKLTQEDFAEQFGYTRTAISAWEIGRNEPSSTDMVKLANFFNVSTDYLLGKSNIRNAEKELENTSNNSEILSYCNQLNEKGKQTLTDYVKVLTKMPEYTEKKEKSQEA